MARVAKARERSLKSQRGELSKPVKTSSGLQQPARSAFSKVAE
jgi:hypothetical protein